MAHRQGPGGALANTYFGIQYLRGIAALAVVIFHANERNGYNFVVGAAGVDVFFVISGFIMWLIAGREGLTPLTFFMDRLTRIAPAYWVATAVMIVGALFGLLPNIVLTWQHIAGSFLFIPHYSPAKGEIWPVLVQGWTLNYEMFFYALFAVTLFLRRGTRLPVLAAMLVVLVFWGHLFEPDNPMLATYSRPIILEFLLGILIARWWLSEAVKPSASAGFAAFAVAAGGFCLIALTGSAFSEVVHGPLSGLLLVSLLLIERAGRLPVSRALGYLGDSSYSIYLWHTMGIGAVLKASETFGLPSALSVVVGILAGVALGALAYELIEKPVARLLKRHRGWPYRGPVVETAPKA
ncbi:acyltransferase family protein [Mesorhizobium sp. NBSH29]|uniref:acyltransferase family protein n=1 Tax=Mesorhizobium sp. NBSH29 TaxID=2654249 RepID=UPI0018965B12|nr:acyltransferase [Mesorhizobium sp. NBSH29]QPC86626.1 acyltransferase family protein [Mesorhizobium sp. NBSH29]